MSRIWYSILFSILIFLFAGSVISQPNLNRGVKGDVAPDGTEYAVIDEDGNIYIFDANNDIRHAFTINIPNQDIELNSGYGGYIPTALEYSPTGEKLAVVISDNLFSGILHIVSLGEGNVGEIVESLETDSINNISWSADGTKLALALKNGSADQDLFSSLSIIDITTLSEIHRRTLFNVNIHDVDWNQTSGIIAYATGRNVILWDTDEAAQIANLTASLPVHRLQWSPSGNRLALLETNGHIQVFDTENLTSITSFNLNSSQYGSPNLYWRNETQIVAALYTDVELWNIDEINAVEILPHNDLIDDLIVISTGQIVIVDRQQLNIWIPTAR